LALVGDARGLRAAYSARSVHRLRVAARRLRAALRLFHGEVPARKARAWTTMLQRVLDALGPARDADVWLGRLGDRKAVGLPAAHPDWPLILAVEEQRLASVHAAARAYLSGRGWAAVQRSLAPLASGRKRAASRTSPLPPAAVRRLRRLLERLARSKRPLKGCTPAQEHEFRRRCRRARYWMEFAAPALGAKGDRLRRGLVRIADLLGEERDARLAVRRLARRRVWWAGLVRRRSERRATTARRDFERRWRKHRRTWDGRALRQLLPG
jgi:triphosphatase